jgi:ADP-heptose:LPS heptosyltransferase
VADMNKALREWWRVIKQGGLLVLYLPHKDFYPHVGTTGANPDHKRDLGPRDVIAAMPDGWDLIDCQDRNEGIEYSFLLVFKKLNSKVRAESWKRSKPEKTVCVVRYGAFGDILQATSVYKGLKDQGYHVTVFASPPGSDVLINNPNIDNLVLFDRDQVPNANLGDFWRWQAKKFDKFVNLSESVEGTLLSMPARISHTWHPILRHKMMNHNYLQFQHELAGVPHKPQIGFFPSQEEKMWARKTRNKMGTHGPIIMYSLSGSSVHKTWPGLDNVIAGIMLHSETAHVVLVGGPECVILEGGWDKEPRVHLTSGQWSIRQTLSFLEHCDLVIGPETGVLNAASHMEMKKVVFLSHSSHENLTRDWVNTHPLWAEKTKCPHRPDGVPACHMLHYGWDYCVKNEETATAQCQTDISVEQVWDVVGKFLSETKEREAA